MQYGTARHACIAYTDVMELEDMKTAVVLAWAIVWSVIAVSLVTSTSTWLLVVGAGVLPAFVMLRMWHPRAQAAPAIVRK